MNNNAMTDAIISAIATLPPEQRAEWRRLHGVHGDAPITLDWRTLPRWTPEHRSAVEVVLHDYALSRSDVCAVLNEIVICDLRVGVWLACACARHALYRVRDGESRPRLAIETAERWVRGATTTGECRENAAAATMAAVDADHAAATYADYGDDDIAAAFIDTAMASYSAGYAAATVFDPKTPAYAASTAASVIGAGDVSRAIASATRDALDAAAEGYRAQVREPFRRGDDVDGAKTLDAPSADRVPETRIVSAFWVTINWSGAVFVKTDEYFRSQDGLTEDWGRHWRRVHATSLEHAREVGCALKGANPYQKQASYEGHLPSQALSEREKASCGIDDVQPTAARVEVHG